MVFPHHAKLALQLTDALMVAKAATIANGTPWGWPEVTAALEDALAKRGEAPAPAFGDRKAIPPSPDQVSRYSASIGYPLDGQAWCDSYAQKGWKVGKTTMKDWQAAVRTWKSNGHKFLNSPAAGQPAKDYTKY